VRAVFGGNEGGGVRPLLDSGQMRGAGAFFRASSALPRCEARFQLLHGAGLRGLFGARWALPTRENQANKQRNF
jgi:hypothetical protein